ncbi:MAG: tetratricopeptide repeat protein [Steroidobacteraceae bacterium]|jgi:predicted O-linked N-acetylglucosamine transferase (SPINDLY family)
MPLADLAAKLEEARLLHEQRLLTRAQAIYEEILKAVPNHFHALHRLGIIAGQKNDPKGAVELIEKAIACDPNNKATCAAHMNLGLAFMELGKPDAAIISYEQAIALDSEYAEAYYARGIALEVLRRPDAALASYDRAIAIKANHADAHVNRGNTLRGLRRFEEAIASYDAAIALNPRIKFVHGIRQHTRMQICEWNGFDAAVSELRGSISSDQATSSPFYVLALADSAPLQRRAAEIRVRELCPPRQELGAIKKRPRQAKMHIGYFSADCHEHATMVLMAGVFERHDRAKVDLTIFSFGPDTNDAMRRRLRSACGAFIDVRRLSDIEIAKLARKRQVDIAIDLKGFTDGNRAGIFALRTAPLQVNFLGYPGTMGASYIDYMIADPTLIPEHSQAHYTEKIIYLPHSYQPNDKTRRLADKASSRAELGLPASAFVFCCFNNNYKITPAAFDCWMRILGRIDGSVLWLLEDNPSASSNLRREAAKRGVNPQRLVFAKRAPLPDHLARQRAADLFIDTLPYNAHTTASDALWAELPVLTMRGESFAGRVGASLLMAAGLPDLVTSSWEQYEHTAVALAGDATRLADIRRRLAGDRQSAPLFDVQLFTKHLEQAYRQIYERYHRDAGPEHIHVAARQ